MATMRDRLSGIYSHVANRTFSVYWQARAPHVLPALAITTSDVVLEIGAGAGLWTSYLAPRSGRYVALEIDRRAIQHAQEWRSPHGGRPTATAHFVRADAQALPFADASFDVVFAVDVIEHIPDDGLACREIARVLRPGGRLGLTTLLADRPSYLRRLEFPDHAREYSLDTLSRPITDAGLELQRFPYFYDAFSTIARELQVQMHHRPYLGLVPGPAFRAMTAVGHRVPIGRPGGIMVVARKP